MDTVYILVIENNNPNTHLKLKGFFSKDMIDFVRISNDCDKNVILNFGTNSFLFDMYEYPSTSFGNKTGEPSWTEYLYWKPVARNINIPIEHIYKYYNEDLVSTEIERRTEFKNHYSKVIEQRINADY